jgi:serine/threonine protein kinase
MDGTAAAYSGVKLATLGVGRFSAVHCYRREKDGKVVAVKVYLNDVRGAPERCALEVSMLKRLASLSPYVSQLVISSSSVDALNTVEMELCPAGSLNKHIHQHFQGGMHINVATGYAVQLVSALCSLERSGIVHRDIKSSNCILDCSGNLKLCDFGSASVLKGENSDNDRTGNHTTGKKSTITGTPHAMAPEMVAAVLGYGNSVDYWSLGVLLYELLTGHIPPWDRPTNADHGSRPNSSQGAQVETAGTDDIRASGVVSASETAIWPSGADQKVAFKAVELSRRVGATVNIADAGEVRSITRASWFIEAVDEPFVLKRRAGTGSSGGYGMTERERRQYSSAVDLVRALLTVSPDLRLEKLRAASSTYSNPPASTEAECPWSTAVRGHPVFIGVDWAAVDSGTAPSPNPDFDRRLGCMELLSEYDDARDVITEAQQDLFAGF